MTTTHAADQDPWVLIADVLDKLINLLNETLLVWSYRTKTYERIIETIATLNALHNHTDTRHTAMFAATFMKQLSFDKLKLCFYVTTLRKHVVPHEVLLLYQTICKNTKTLAMALPYTCTNDKKK